MYEYVDSSTIHSKELFLEESVSYDTKVTL